MRRSYSFLFDTVRKGHRKHRRNNAEDFEGNGTW